MHNTNAYLNHLAYLRSRPFRIGDRVTWKFYGETKRGTVTRVGKSAIVFVKGDNGRTYWCHTDNLWLI